MNRILVLCFVFVFQIAEAGEPAQVNRPSFMLNEMDDSEMDSFSAQFATPEQLQKNMDSSSSVVEVDLNSIDVYNNQAIEIPVNTPQGITHNRMTNNLIP